MGERFAGFAKALGLKKQNLIFIAGLVGILLLAFAKLPAMGPPTKNVPPTQPVGVSSGVQAGYEQQLEQRLESILGSIAGVGRVQVMVTLESGYGYEYAKENKVNSDRLADTKAAEEQKTQEKNTSEENYVMLDATGGGQKPLVTQEIIPKIKGVVVVCDGGDSATTVSSVIETVRVAASLTSTQISVSKMGQNIP